MNPELGLNLTSLNIEGDNHLEPILSFLNETDSDVVCLQEVLEKDIHLIEERIGMKVVRYVPLVRFNGPNNARMPEDSTWGMLYLVKKDLEVIDTEVKYYKKNNQQLPEYVPDNPNSVDRAIVAATVVKNGEPYRVITTHFTWSPHGKPIPEQIENMRSLLDLLADEKEFVLCGDTNAPRNGPIWQMLASNYHDNIPTNVTTTLDKTLHRAADEIGDYVVDCLFSTPRYRTEDVRATLGVSDHMAISGVIYRISN